jgi:monothiol glutaredoxin
LLRNLEFREKGKVMSDVKNRIDSEIASSDIVLFMKGTPEAPQCGFSMQVVQILNHVGAPYKAINVLADPEIRDGIKAFSNWPTIPQLYVKKEFIGGCDITREMFQSGELTALFDKEGIAHKLAKA